MPTRDLEWAASILRVRDIESRGPGATPRIRPTALGCRYERETAVERVSAWAGADSIDAMPTPTDRGPMTRTSPVRASLYGFAAAALGLLLVHALLA